MTPRRRFPRRAGLAWGLLLSLGAAIVLAHEGHAPLPTKGAQVDPEKGHLVLTADARKSIDVETAVVESQSVEETILAYATITSPWQKYAHVSTQLPGRVRHITLRPGETVETGAVLAEIESLELDALQIDLIAAQNEIDLSRKLVEELRASANTGGVAGQSVIDAESVLARNRNALAAARAKWLTLGLSPERLEELLQSRKPLSDLTLPIRAPISGVVVHAEAATGKVITANEHLAEIADLSTVWVRIGVLEKDLGRVRVGQPVELNLVAYPGEVFPTKITATSHYLDPQTNVAVVWAELANPPGARPRFQPGMAGQASIVVSNGKPRLSVPTSAVLREGAEHFVLVEEANTAESSEYHKKAVVVGRESDGRVEVLGGGLFQGDRVVTRGGHELSPFFAPNVLKLSPEAEKTIGLKVEPATMRPIDSVLSLEGAVEVPPADHGFAASQLAGIIQSIRTGPGQAVKAGDVLAEVYSPELLTMQEELLRTHLEANLSETTLASLRNVRGASARRLWELESQANGLRARAEGLRRRLLTAGLTPVQVDILLKKNEMTAVVPVRAPIGGVVVNLDKVLGQAVAAHEPLFEVHDLTAPLVRGFAAERDLGRLRIGQAVRVRLVAEPSFEGTGRIVRSGHTIAADTRSLAVWIELDAIPPCGLLHGQLATVAIVVGSQPAALAVPSSAVIMDGSAAFVFVRKPDGSFERRPIEAGPSDDRSVAITRGLTAGEPVAVAGVAELRTAYASLK